VKIKNLKIVALLVALAMFTLMAAVVAAKEEQKGPFTLTAETTGDIDTFEIILTDLDDDGDDDNAKLEIKLEIQDSQGDWELELEGPDGEDLGVLTSESGENEFKLEIKGEVEEGVYLFTFTNTGTDLAQISGEYKVELKGEDDDDDGRYFFDAGARIAIYIIKVEVTYIINIWGIDDDGQGYEAIVISLEDIYELIRERLDLDVTVVINIDDLELEENLFLTESEDGKVKLYLLTTGEFQVNVGPFEDGTVQVFIYDSFPPTRVYRKDFNVYTLLETFAVQAEIDDDGGDDGDD
jgi:hypothetical protein